MKTDDWPQRLARLFGIRTVHIAEDQRGLLYRDRRAVRVLRPGRTRLFGHPGPLDLRLCSVATPAYAGRDAEALIETLGDALARDFQLIEAAPDEVLLISADGQLIDALAPGRRRLYWRTEARLRIERLQPALSPQVPEDLLRPLERIGRTALVQIFEVPPGATGQVLAQGRRLQQHGPGHHAYWIGPERLQLRVRMARAPRPGQPDAGPERKAA